MIHNDELIYAGRYNKPHGIHGELSLSFDVDVDPVPGLCLVSEIDGINVPFFVDTVRPKGAGTVLVRIDGMASEQDAALLANKEVYLLKRDCEALGLEETEGFFLDDLVGMTVADTEWGTIGEVVGYDDRTANLLIEIRRPDGSTVSVPMADEFVVDFNPDEHLLLMNLPEGLPGF